MILYTLPTTGGHGDAPIGDKSDRRQSGGGDDFNNMSGDQLGMLIHTINMIVYVYKISLWCSQVRTTLWM